MGLVAGERTVCELTDDRRFRCRGGFALADVTPEGALTVDDTGLCGRDEGAVTCLSPRGRREVATPFVEWRQGPGAPCGLGPEGRVWCATGPVREGDDTALVEVPLPSPARALGGDGTNLVFQLEDGAVVSVRPPAHGGGRPRTLATRTVSFASDGWTAACWAVDDGVTCADGRRFPRAWSLAVGAGIVCGTGPDGTWCDPVRDLGEAPADKIVAGTGFACALRSGLVRCAGP